MDFDLFTVARIYFCHLHSVSYMYKNLQLVIWSQSWLAYIQIIQIIPIIATKLLAIPILESIDESFIPGYSKSRVHILRSILDSVDLLSRIS